MDPARNFKKRNFTESLTPDPELENNQGQKRRFGHVRAISGLPSIATRTRTWREVGFVPIGDIQSLANAFNPSAVQRREEPRHLLQLAPYRDD